MLKNNDSNPHRYNLILDKYNTDLDLQLAIYIDNYINLCNVYKPNPRQLIRIMNKFSLLKYNFDEKQSFFLFIVLIYNELNILELGNTKEFLKNFTETHKSFYGERFKQYQKKYPRNSDSNSDQFFEYLYNRHYTNESGSILEELFSYIQYSVYYYASEYKKIINHISLFKINLISINMTL